MAVFPLKINRTIYFVRIITSVANSDWKDIFVFERLQNDINRIAITVENSFIENVYKMQNGDENVF